MSKSRKSPKIDAKTGRPDSAYPRQQSDAERYVDEFSRALKLKRAVTRFGRKKVKV